jgi:hypothetical protein
MEDRHHLLSLDFKGFNFKSFILQHRGFVVNFTDILVLISQPSQVAFLVFVNKNKIIT